MLRFGTSFFLWFLSALTVGSDAYKVLVYHPITGHSHMKFMGTVSQILVEEGYDVTLLMPIVDSTLKDLTPLLKKIDKRIIVDVAPEAQKIIDGMGGSDTRKLAWGLRPSIHGFIEVGANISNVYKHTCDNLFNQHRLLAGLRAENFDIAISEPLFICGFALADYLGIQKTVTIDSHIGLQPVKTAHGDPNAASFLPASFSSAETLTTVFGRMKNAVETFLSSYFVENIYEKELAIIKDRYNKKSWQDLLYDTAFVFVNSNPFIDFPYPTTAKTIPIGGLTIDTSKLETESLPEEYDNILSLRSSNVLISFGSNARSIDMPLEYKNALLKVFEKMPETTFIWKYEDPETDIIRKYNSSLNNVVLTSWMPQMALLADPRLNVFLTHGGLGSTMELAYRGKPSVMVPVFGDQARNARMMERHGAAILLKKTDLANPDVIISALRRMIQDKSYIERAQKLSIMLHNQAFSPRELFVKYMKFASRYGKVEAMNTEARNLTTIQYYFLDAAALLFGLVFLISSSCFFSLARLRTLALSEATFFRFKARLHLGSRPKNRSETHPYHSERSQNVGHQPTFKRPRLQASRSGRSHRGRGRRGIVVLLLSSRSVVVSLTIPSVCLHLNYYSLRLFFRSLTSYVWSLLS
ncbi:unnamed protein product [Caenorhabditis auriculariae]|uniref:glucuronosyltransferase n=1 Tax=Caenorhabditis auriculariae TaxID=2777116 RepID=A0A8S1HJR0_9PELO|nr:unnamed protein product [Caenorhabditis auriculariae]